MAAIPGMPEEPHATQIQRQRLTLLFQQAQAASTGAAVGALVCTVVFYKTSPGIAPLLWLGAIVLFTSLRFRVYRQFFTSKLTHAPESYWLPRHAATAALVGLAWGSVPLIEVPQSAPYVRQLQILIPAFVLMAAISSYGVYFSQYVVLWTSIVLSTLSTRLYASGAEAVPEVLLFALFVPVLLVTASRFSASLFASMQAKHQAEQLVHKLTVTNDDLNDRNRTLAHQQDIFEQEEALAQHVFQQLIIGGDRKVPGIHTWNQSMGTLSGDLTQTARGPAGQAYVLLADFTGHGLPAALGALPASSVFLAMAAKGLPLNAIASELNSKLNQLLPVGYFCCAVLIELAADYRMLRVWNGGLPPVLVRRRGEIDYERIASHSLPLGVVGADEFDAQTHEIRLATGDVVYAYTDGLIEAENSDGEMWGADRLEIFLATPDLPTPHMPALIDAILDHVNLAPPSDDISVVEIEALGETQTAAQADADAA